MFEQTVNRLQIPLQVAQLLAIGLADLVASGLLLFHKSDELPPCLHTVGARSRLLAD